MALKVKAVERLQKIGTYAGTYRDTGTVEDNRVESGESRVESAKSRVESAESRVERLDELRIEN